MTLLLLFFLLEYSNFAPLPAADADAKCSQNDLFILSKASIIRENYKDVTSQFNGALLSSARKTIFWHQVLKIAVQEIYCITTLQMFIKGMLLPDLANQQFWNFYQHTKLILQGFWMWDIDDRQTDRQVLTVAPDRMTEIVIYDGNAQAKILPILNLLYVNNVNNQKNIFHIFSFNQYKLIQK
ncbi:unnamed protein product [Paramecium pentaurelia]|uniref:Uncharacterized protein n=2 Tax=Paramecium pentaurelia TaxID=43138 RepID=A0A8S1YHM6_9CILI|nr:unnamed protein product [Paramecium pentaurelia]